MRHLAPGRRVVEPTDLEFQAVETSATPML